MIYYSTMCMSMFYPLMLKFGRLHKFSYANLSSKYSSIDWLLERCTKNMWVLCQIRKKGKRN